MSVKRIIVGGVIIGGIAAMLGYFFRQFNLLYNSCYAVVGVIIHDFSFDKVKLTLLLKLQNKSDISVKITKQKYDIYVNGMNVGVFHSQQPFTLYSDSVNTLPIDVTFNPKDLLKTGVSSIAAILGDKSKFIIGIKGTLTAESGIAQVKDLIIETEMSLKEIMEEDNSADVCDNFSKDLKRKNKRRR